MGNLFSTIVVIVAQEAKLRSSSDSVIKV